MLRKMLLTFLLAISTNLLCYAMQDDAMTDIQSLEDVTPFVGKVVAYQTTSAYLKHRESYIIKANALLGYAYIENDLPSWRGKGYEIIRLLKSNAMPNNCAITNFTVKDAHLQLRLATKEEIDKMRWAIESGKAELEHILDEEEALSILSND